VLHSNRTRRDRVIRSVHDSYVFAGRSEPDGVITTPGLTFAEKEGA
jgi:hypothetical protein